MDERGRYIVIEGSDGTGKTTVADVLAQKLRDGGRTVIRVDEPGSAYRKENEPLVPIASELQRIVKDGTLGRSALTNALLLTASRRENWLQVSEPALEQGLDVISARNYWSTLVYQGYGEGLDRGLIDYLTRLSVGPFYMKPSHAVILDLNDEAERQRRIQGRGQLEKPDNFESKGDEFQQKLRLGYRAIARELGVPVIHVDNQSPQDIADHLLGDLF